ncbi:uncharacterized protein N7484_005853 [Penicillium longicatenatum]|uniref:uncharacterized protein n=1 Tax=Penicillium longicatenatum TaxID=1561947 RepID=UPI002548644B|nr:uncharacterized protein N7484_005853 [Penicillium longicatenatum]KAJ5643346.1 hypothetical protein N7484_005853 [Penicillium longicatenatum]
MPSKNEPALLKVHRTKYRGAGAGPIPKSEPFNTSFSMPPKRPWRADSGVRLLSFTNHQIADQMDRVNCGIGEFMGELEQLETHIKDLNHPLLLGWEADIITRLIEVAHSKEPNLSSSSILLTAHYLDRETMSRGYSLAARKISLETLHKFGLREQHHEVLRRYDELVEHRSKNPFHTESFFARWLVHNRLNIPEKYAFWAPFFLACYGRSINESASFF